MLIKASSLITAGDVQTRWSKHQSDTDLWQRFIDT